MNQKQFENLKRGDLVRHKGSGDAYVVERTHPAVIAIRSVTVTNPPEWSLVDVDGRILDVPEERRYTKEEVVKALEPMVICGETQVRMALERLP